MSETMLQVHEGEPVVSTEVLAEGFGVSHKAVLVLIRKYENRFNRVRLMVAHTTINKQGKPTRFFQLNEQQASFLGTLLKNTDEAVDFKERLTSEFFRIRKALSRILSQKQNAEWLDQRKKGIIARKEETDIIKEFVEYAKAQGSRSAEMYYMNISKMQNQALFLLTQKYPNLRNVLDCKQLSIISSADQIVSRWLKIGMERGLPYKEIYQLCKEKIEAFAEVVGKSPVSCFLENKQPELLEAAS